jgi:integrase
MAKAKNGRARTHAVAVDGRGKDFLTEAEMDRYLGAARQGRHGVRDHCMMLVMFRHAYRVSELIDVRLKDLDLGTARLFVRRKKGSLSTHQPIEGDELRAIRAWLRERQQRPDARSSYLFLSERGSFTRQAVNYWWLRSASGLSSGFMSTRICCGTRRATTWRTKDATRG